MSQFIVSVEGKLVVEADDASAAKDIVTGLLAARQPWLKVAYGEPTRIGQATVDLTTDQLVKM